MYSLFLIKKILILMKTIPKSQYLLLKLQKNYETNLKNQTVEITDEEYDNLIQYKNIKYDNDNLEGARLVYTNNYDKNKKIINIIYGQNSDTYANIDYIKSSSSFFYIVFNNGTYKNIPTSELLFKLKNNIGKLKGKNNEESLTSSYRLEYIYPNEMNSDVIQETVIAEYKGLTCEFCDINVYKSDYSFNFENQKIYTGQKPTNFLNEYIDENEYSNASELRININNYYILMEIRNND